MAKSPAPQPGPQRQPNPAQQIPTNQPAVSATADPAGDDLAEEESGSGYRFVVFALLPSWLVSMIVHAILIILLALINFSKPGRELLQVIADKQPDVEELEDFELDEIIPVDEQVLENETPLDSEPVPDAAVEANADVPFTEEFEDPVFDISEMNPTDALAPTDLLSTPFGALSAAPTGGRSGARRAEMVKEAGGSEGSERAVEAALRWLAAHQLPDGSWNFNHQLGPGAHRNSPDPGEETDAVNGATALALLPFLGAGQTHLEGKYKENVRRGLMYLIAHQRPSGGGGSFHERGGNMYSHGICTIALTEAYAMTNDRDLIAPAQGAINYIVYAQDPVGGGWRYTPRQAGDTSVVGWQLMGLKSGLMGYLEVPPDTIRGAERFLGSVQQESGAYYGYVSPGQGPATTAVGLLCRMYMGWEHDHPGIVKGVEFLSNRGPSGPEGGQVDMYYNYYATQVMRHYGGTEWEKWNGQLRDWLVNQQEKEGNMEGSWFFPHAWSGRGGRLYCTAMGCMILEVYYRHMPIYRAKATDEEFPL
ncbi:MAG: terpene cyclase/mutase family protein [Planctomycetales bacterium]|nr:terpene cyclase/mutase family protein [Planctomycetales bacterium]